MTKHKPRILIFIITYNARDHIESVLDRIPEAFWSHEQYETEVLILDDASKDETALLGALYAERTKREITVLANPVNQGYGGNQKLGYAYALKKEFDAIVLLHGDGQYPPEQLNEMIAPIIEGQADAVFGSRMLRKRDALKGGMPLYKFVGNIILTRFQNMILGSKLSEFHTGYRAYSLKVLQTIPFQHNSNDFDFDTDIIIQLVNNHFHIAEIPIPTRYGDEICHVNGMKYAFQVVRSTLLSRMQRYAIFYDPKFNRRVNTPDLRLTNAHHYAIDKITPNSTVLDFGCGNGNVAQALQEKGCTIHGYDLHYSETASKYCKTLQITDLDHLDIEPLPSADSILLLGTIEHLKAPEQFMEMLRHALAGRRPEIIITTGNITFFLVRLSMLIGQFNYGQRGILNMDHRRLFTFRSLIRMLNDQGYEILEVKGIPAPYTLVFGERRIAYLLTRLNRYLIRLSKGLFAFQIGVVAKPLPTLEQLLADARETHAQSFSKSRTTLGRVYEK